MNAKVTLQYNRETDVLYINSCAPYAEQASKRMGGQLIVRLSPTNGVIENLEIPLFFTRLLQSETLELPLAIDFRWARRP